MPTTNSIAQQMAFCTMRIECRTSAGQIRSGTGFFFTFVRENVDPHCPLLITNRHVVDGAVSMRLRFTRATVDGSPMVGHTQELILEDPEQHWRPHPDQNVDLSSLNLAGYLTRKNEEGLPLFVRYVDEKLLPDEADIAALNALDPIVMVGYPNALSDTRHNLPIFRQGIAATDPRIDFEGRQEFLIDAPCFPGSSGSPVFLYAPKPGLHFEYSTGHPALAVGSAPRVKLLGVLRAGPLLTVNGNIEVVPIPTLTTPVAVSSIPMNLGFVIKSQRIREFRALF